VPLGRANFTRIGATSRPFGGENADFWPVSKFNTGSLTLRGILPVKNMETPHFRTYSRRALPQTLHGDSARRGHKKVVIIF